MPTFTNKSFAKAALNTVLSTYYTTPANTTAIIGGLTVCNTGNTERAVTVNFGGKALLSAVPVAANETVGVTVPHVLDAAETIQAQQDVGTDVELLASGVEVT